MSHNYYEEIIEELGEQSDNDCGPDTRVILSDGRKVSFHELASEIAIRMMATQNLDEDGTPSWETDEYGHVLSYSGILSADKETTWTLAIADTQGIPVANFQKIRSASQAWREENANRVVDLNGRINVRNYGYGRYAGQQMFGWEISAVIDGEFRYILKNGNTNHLLKVLNDLKDAGVFTGETFSNLPDFPQAVEQEFVRENQRIKFFKNRRSSTPIYEVSIRPDGKAISWNELFKFPDFDLRSLELLTNNDKCYLKAFLSFIYKKNNLNNPLEFWSDFAIFCADEGEFFFEEEWAEEVQYVRDENNSDEYEPEWYEIRNSFHERIEFEAKDYCSQMISRILGQNDLRKLVAAAKKNSAELGKHLD